MLQILDLRLTRAPARVVAVLLATACVSVRLKCSYTLVASPFQIDYEEGNILNAAYRLIHGQTPYPSPGSFPYVLNPYGPIGYVLSAWGVKIFGLSFFGPRLLVLFAGLGVLFLIAGLIKTCGGRWDLGFLLALSYLCAPVVWYWLPLLRVDFWAVFLSLLGIYVFAAYPRALPLIGLIFGLALLTKQTAIAAPTAVFLELLARKRLGRALGLAVIAGGMVVACMAALGQDFVFVLLKTHPDPYNPKLALQFYFGAIDGCMLILAIIIYGLVFGVRWNQHSRLAWFYLAMSTLTALSAGKLGSNMNHFLEWTAAVCIVGGVVLSYLWLKKDLLAKPFTLGLLALALIFAVVSQRTSAGIVAEQSGCGEAYAFVRSFPGNRILSENVSSLVLGRKPVLVSNPFVMTQLGSSVDWRAGSLESFADKEYFDLILLDGEVEGFRPESGRWSPELIRSVEKHYLPIKYFQCPYARVAYVPKFH